MIVRSVPLKWAHRRARGSAKRSIRRSHHNEPCLLRGRRTRRHSQPPPERLGEEGMPVEGLAQFRKSNTIVRFSNRFLSSERWRSASLGAGCGAEPFRLRSTASQGHRLLATGAAISVFPSSAPSISAVRRFTCSSTIDFCWLTISLAFKCVLSPNCEAKKNWMAPSPCRLSVEPVQARYDMVCQNVGMRIASGDVPAE